MSKYKELRAECGVDADGKKIYRTIGRLLEDTKAGPMIKIDTLPLMWTGWAYVSEPRPKEESKTHGEMKRGNTKPTDMDAEAPF